MSLNVSVEQVERVLRGLKMSKRCNYEMGSSSASWQQRSQPTKRHGEELEELRKVFEEYRRRLV